LGLDPDRIDELDAADFNDVYEGCRGGRGGFLDGEGGVSLGLGGDDESRFMSRPLFLFFSSGSSIQSSRSINDVFLPKFGGDGDGECFGGEGVRTTGGWSAAAVAAESGASMSKEAEGVLVLPWSSFSALSLPCEVAPPARDSKAAIRDWRADIVTVGVEGVVIG
jgi:hypothetical protein